MLENNKLIVKFMWKCKKPRIDKTVVKKMSMLQDLHYQTSICYKGKVIKEAGSNNRSHTHSHLNCDKRLSGGRRSFLINDAETTVLKIIFLPPALHHT